MLDLAPLRRHAVRFASTLVLAAALTACSSVPAEATQQHAKAVAALSTHDKEAFRALVLPAQRTGPLGIVGDLGVESDKPLSKLTLDDVLDIEFFADAKTVSVEKNLETKYDDATVWLGVSFGYDEGMFGTRSLVLTKVDGVWYVDMKGTLEQWAKSGNGFMIMGLKPKK